MAANSGEDRVTALERECAALRRWARATAAVAVVAFGVGVCGLLASRPGPAPQASQPAPAGPAVVDEVRLAVPGSGTYAALRFDPKWGLVAESPKSDSLMMFDWKERPR